MAPLSNHLHLNLNSGEMSDLMTFPLVSMRVRYVPNTRFAVVVEATLEPMLLITRHSIYMFFIVDKILTLKREMLLRLRYKSVFSKP